MGPRIREDARTRGERRQAPALRSMGPRMREDKGGKIGGDTGAHAEPVSETGWCLMVGTWGWPHWLKLEPQE